MRLISRRSPRDRLIFMWRYWWKAQAAASAKAQKMPTRTPVLSSWSSFLSLSELGIETGRGVGGVVVLHTNDLELLL